MNIKTSDKMSIILKMCFAVLLALSIAASVESASTGVTAVPTTKPVTVHTLPPLTHPMRTEQPLKICDVTYSCGWGIYEQTAFKRTLTYFMKNSCRCPDDEYCIRVDDDINISAYVYKCRTKDPNAEIVTPVDYY